MQIDPKEKFYRHFQEEVASTLRIAPSLLLLLP